MSESAFRHCYPSDTETKFWNLNCNRAWLIGVLVLIWAAGRLSAPNSHLTSVSLYFLDHKTALAELVHRLSASRRHHDNSYKALQMYGICRSTDCWKEEQNDIEMGI